jgi:hypothetical protein
MAYVEPEVAAEAGAGPPEADQHGAADGPHGAADSRLAVDIRGRAEPAVLTPLPFYHRTHERPR